MEGFSPFGNVAVILSFLICLALLVAKTRLIHRILKAKTDVNVFNHSIALCFAMSGETFNQFGIQTGGFTLKHHMHKKAEILYKVFSRYRRPGVHPDHYLVDECSWWRSFQQNRRSSWQQCCQH